MRNKTKLTVLAAAGFLSVATLANPATAMTFATPSTLGVATIDTGVVQKAYWGYRRWGYRRWGYYHRPYYGFYRPYYGLYGYYRPWGYHRPWGWRRRWWW
jgi:hypothetical protein